MAQSVRIEFLHLSVAGPINLIKAVEAASIDDFSVTSSATAAGSRPVVPSGGIPEVIVMRDGDKMSFIAKAD